MPKTSSDSKNTGDDKPVGYGDRNTELEKTIDSTKLTAVCREVTISHSGERYRLRVTSNDKLNLTQ